MALPFFYHAQMPDVSELILDEETSRHIVQVLRMDKDDAFNLTDGKGNICLATIMEPHKKHCQVSLQERHYTAPAAERTTIAISLLKNATRFEWFLEKATELGISEIIPLICDRTEKEKFRYARLQQIVISAMLQSQQSWLPVLHQPIGFKLLLRQEEIIATPHKWIAHCVETSRTPLGSETANARDSQVILIGPEGDFTKDEIEFALQNHFQPVTLGQTRLRTETAGVVAATIMKLA